MGGGGGGGSYTTPTLTPCAFSPSLPPRAFLFSALARRIHSNSARTILKGLRVGSLPEGVGVRIAAGAAGSGGDGGSMLPYLVPVLVLAFAVWYQMFGGAEVLGMGGSASSVAAPGGA